MSATDPTSGTSSEGPQGGDRADETRIEAAGAVPTPAGAASPSRADAEQTDPFPHAPASGAPESERPAATDPVPGPAFADPTATGAGDAGQRPATAPESPAAPFLQRSSLPSRPRWRRLFGRSAGERRPAEPDAAPAAAAWSGPAASPSQPPGHWPDAPTGRPDPGGPGVFAAAAPGHPGAAGADPSSQPTDPYGFGAHPAGGHSGGGHGQPPFHAHGAFAAGPPEPPAGKRPGQQRLLLVAGATALVTSLIVGPAAAVITTQVLSGDGSSTSSSLTAQPSGSVSSGSVSTVASKTLPSVVSISTSTGSGGSGVIISSDGQILTNNHVVAGARDNEINVQFNDGSEATATVLGADPVSDLAVIKVDKTGLTPAEFGDSDKVEVGADVVAIGSPLGLSGTVTSGVVSAVDRPVNTGVSEEQQPEQQQRGLPFGLPGEQDGQGLQGQQGPTSAQTSTVINAIQTDAPINPGNSGGPLMNMDGEVIGINTAIAGTGDPAGGQSGSIGLGFAIPINQARPIAEQLIEDGRADYAAIDATITAARTADEGQGAGIVQVGSNGAAAEAGLREGDVITKVDDRTVTDPDVLIAAIRSHQPGDTVTITYERDGRTHEAEVTLSAQSADSIGG
ncbi:S1C family serine protease [Marinactinospora rubrisoli]|uniref:Trypsin-like peptidase domain-containing protein n=1 Tax=Marinactinospora rubrisoli TaxID=2715399 RepID=A0ABW2KAW7_9ACTN